MIVIQFELAQRKLKVISLSNYIITFSEYFKQSFCTMGRLISLICLFVLARDRSVIVILFSLDSINCYNANEC